MFRRLIEMLLGVDPADGGVHWDSVDDLLLSPTDTTPWVPTDSGRAEPTAPA